MLMHMRRTSSGDVWSVGPTSCRHCLRPQRLRSHDTVRTFPTRPQVPQEASPRGQRRPTTDDKSRRPLGLSHCTVAGWSGVARCTAAWNKAMVAEAYLH